MTRFAKILFAIVLILSGWACTPGGGNGSPKDSCRSQSDCEGGEICNPGSLRCIADVSVGRNEFAGTFEFVIAPDGAGQEQNMYAKADMGGVVYEINQVTIFGGTENSISFDFRSRMDEETWIALIFSIPIGLVNVESGIPLSDGLNPADGETGDGILALHDPRGEGPDDDVIIPIAEVESGSFLFTRFEGDVGGTISGQFQGTLMPATYFTALGWMPGCPDGQLLDLNLSCNEAFSGYDFLASLESVYKGSGSEGGRMIVSYRAGEEEQTYRLGAPCYSFDYESNAVIQGIWKTTPDAQYRMMQVVFPRTKLSSGSLLGIGTDASVTVFAGVIQGDGTVEFNDILATGASGQLTVRHFQDGPNGRVIATMQGMVSAGGSISEGQDCQVSNDQCREPYVCYPTGSADAGNCFTPCTSGSDCISPRDCVRFNFQDGPHDICVEMLGDFVTGCDGQSMKWCTDGWCVNHEYSGITETICMPDCDPSSGEGCLWNQTCLELTDPSKGACYRNINRDDSCNGSEILDGYLLCTSTDICTTSDSTNWYCRQDCTSNHYSCPADWQCLELQNGKWACFP